MTTPCSYCVVEVDADGKASHGTDCITVQLAGARAEVEAAEKRADTLEEESLHTEALLRAEEEENGRLRTRLAALEGAARAVCDSIADGRVWHWLNLDDEQLATLQRLAEVVLPTPAPESPRYHSQAGVSDVAAALPIVPIQDAAEEA